MPNAELKKIIIDKKQNEPSVVKVFFAA